MRAIREDFLRSAFLPRGIRQGGLAWSLMAALVIAAPAQAQETQVPPTQVPPTRAPPTQIPDTSPVPTPEAPVAEADPVATERPLQFAFDGAPWREVIRWLADEGGLALHVDDLPTGSFTYSDPSSFSHQDAIDRVNLFLLAQGYTLVRSGRLLSVINLSDPRSLQQLDTLAKLVAVDQLEDLHDYEVVKCIFPLGELKAEDAVEELSALKLMTTPAVFSKTNRLLITDTAGKLKNVKAILDAFQPSTLTNGTVVKSFALKHAAAEDILVVARPHLGLATGEMIGIDVSLSADLQGKNIFVTGVEDKVKLIEGLVAAIDVPNADATITDGSSELRSHIVEGGNVETVYNVLQTLLAGKSVRLSMDETAGAIVALAAPEVQAEIEQTVIQLQASEAEFAVIPLKSVDPYFVISLLEEMLDLPDVLDDPEDIDPDAPKIDADPGNMRLYVRAKTHQIEQIKKIVAELDETGNVGDSEDIRIFPIRGEQAEQVLELAAKFWRAPNPIILYPSAVSDEPNNVERVVNEGTPGLEVRKVTQSTPSTTPPPRYLTDNIRSQAPAIRCQMTPRGLLMQSDDTQALDKFYEQLRAIVGPTEAMPSPPVVFYLKYTKPEDAIRMLAELLDGGESASEAEAGSLVNGYVSSGSSGFLGSLVSSREGTTTLMSGTITVVADSRLNRLIAQGTASDIERIEGYLKIVDKDNSITSVEVYGTSHVIELKHTEATVVAAALRDAYAGRISGGSRNVNPQQNGQRNQPGSPQQGSPQQGSPQQAMLAQREGGSEKGGDEPQANAAKRAPERARQSGQPARNLEPQMTIAVHEPSNSLIVTAPDQLFNEVEQLAMLIDSRSARTVEVRTLTNAAGIELLQQVLSNGNRRSASPPARPRTAPQPTPAPSPAAFRGRGGR